VRLVGERILLCFLIFLFYDTMGDIKLSKKPANSNDVYVGDVTSHVDYTSRPCRRRNDVRNNAVWTISMITLVIAFGTVNLYQFSEIISLKRRIEHIELNSGLVFGFEVS